MERTYASIKNAWRLLLACVLCLPLMVKAQTTRHVPTPYSTIQAAINAATAGDIIEVAAGAYSEQLTINKALTLKGAQAGVDPRPGGSRTIGSGTETIVQAAKNQTVVMIKANGVVIDGFQFQQPTGSGGAHCIDGDGNYTGTIFRNNIITNLGSGMAVRLYGGTGDLIEKNYLKDISGNGIVLRNGNNQMTPATNQKILDNYLENVNGVGGAIYIYGETDLEIARNVITAKYVGMGIGTDAAAPYYLSKNIHVHHNEVVIGHVPASGRGIVVGCFSKDILIDHNRVTSTSTNTGPQYELVRVAFDGDGAPYQAENIAITNNYFERPAAANERYAVVANYLTNPVDLSCNWWGTTDSSTVNGLVIGASQVHTPFLMGGTDSDGGATGFVPSATCGSGIVHNTTQDKYYATLDAGINDSDPNDHIEILAGTTSITTWTNVDHPLTIKGAGIDQTTVELDPTWFNTNGYNALQLNAANISIEDIHFKVTGATGQGNILGLFASNLQIKNNKFSGAYTFGAGEVTRATVWVASITGIAFENNIIDALRQPGYINGGSGTIKNNSITNTRGWVIAGAGNLAITNNTFGTNATHIAILANSGDLSYLTIHDNDLSGATTGPAIDSQDAGNSTVNASCNWWGTTVANDIASRLGGPGLVTYSPYFVSGDEEAGEETTLGFQPIQPNTCTGTPVEITATYPPITCNGGTTNVSLTVANGLPNYVLDPNNPDVAGVPAGIYTYAVTDALGSNASVTITITQPDALSGTVNATNPNCHGTNTGSITILSSQGGSLSYEYSIDNGGAWQGSNTFAGLAKGTYQVRMRDAADHDCWLDLDGVNGTVLSEPDELSAIATPTIANCYGAATGEILVNAPQGGSGNYEYSVDGSNWYTGPAYTFTGLLADDYTVQVRDAAAPACLVSLSSTTVGEQPQMDATLASTNVTCNGANNGTITVSAPTGGSGSTYNVSIDGGSWVTNPSFPYAFTGLTPGAHTVAIQDGGVPSCTRTIGSITITEPAVLGAGVSPTAILCNGGMSSVTLNITGGTPAYQVSVNGGGFAALAPPYPPPAGAHTFAIQDANNCTTSTNSTISQPSAITFTATAPRIACHNGTTNVTLNITGGTAPFTFSPLNPPVSNRPGGSYTYSATDANGCPDTAQISIFNPGTLQADLAASAVTCNAVGDGTISVSSPTGGYNDYQYSIDGGSTWLPAAGDAAGGHTFTGLTPATYTVQMRDKDTPRCTVTLGNLTISEPIALSATVTTSEATCSNTNDGSITVSYPVGGYGTYECSINGTDWVSVSTGSPYTFTQLAPNTYTAQLRDADHNLCVYSQATVVGITPHSGSDWYVSSTGSNANTGAQGCPFQSVQFAVNTAVDHDVVHVDAGTYNENVTVNKTLTLLGANEGNARCSANNESTIASSNSSPAVTITADNVTINGFEITAPHHITGIEASQTFGTAIRYNFIHDINTGSPQGGGNVQAIRNQTETASGSVWEITDNCIQGVATSPDNYTAQAIGFLHSGATGVLSDINVERNWISGVTATRGAYGIMLGVGKAGVNNGAVDGVLVKDNTISGLSGAWSTAIGLEGNTRNTEVRNNLITGASTVGVMVENNDGASSVKVEDNSFDGLGMGIFNKMPDPLQSAECNWYGNAAAPYVAAHVNGPVDATPYLTSGGNSASVGFTPTGQCEEGPVKVYDTNDDFVASHMTIQAAIDDPTTLNGYTVKVAKGTYAEEITVTKSLDIRGPNYLLAGNDGGRADEAVIIPASDEQWALLAIQADGVSVRGFSFDGVNVDLTPNSWGTGGASLNADVAVQIERYNDALVSNNIMRNLSYFAITAYDDPGPSTESTITNNLIEDLGTYTSGTWRDKWGGGVLLYYDMYAEVQGNEMNDVRIGIQTGQMSSTNAHGSAFRQITGNVIHARAKGIFFNEHYNTSDPWTVSGNVIGAVNSADEAAIANAEWRGMLISGQWSVPTTFSGNDVDGSALTSLPSVGINVWNVSAAATADIQGCTIEGVGTGIRVDNWDGYRLNTNNIGSHASIADVTITPASGGTGIRVLDSPNNGNHHDVVATIGTGVTVDGGAHGLSVEGGNASVVNPLGNIAFTGQSGNYIQLANNANDIDATAASFDLAPDYFAIEDKVLHKIDDAALGLVRVKEDELFVTLNSYNNPATTTPSIQRGIDAADAGNTVHVQGGNTAYEENVTVDKSLTLRGANADIFGCDDGRADESIIAPTTGIPVTVTAGGVTISGFELTAPGALAALTASGVSKLTVTNNNVHDIGTTGGTQPTHAITYEVGTGAPRDLAITHNCITDVGSATSATRGGIYLGSGGSTGSLSGNVEIAYNSISGVTSNNAAYGDGGRGAYGILINAGASGGGSVVNAQVHHNDITGLSGLWATAIGLEGTTPGAQVKNNLVSNLTASQALYRTGVKLESNTGVNTVVINDNSFSGVDYGINRDAGNTSSDPQSATCNWYGSGSANDVQARLNNITNYTNYLTSGADTDDGAIGFVPDPSNCNGTPVVVALASGSPVNVTCNGGTDGSIDVDITGGTYPTDMTFAWTGPNGFISNSEDISGLVAGTYNLLVTDGNGSTDDLEVEITEPAKLSATVGILPGTICYGTNTTATFNGPIDGTVTYTVNSGAPTNILLDGSGQATLPLNGLTVNTTIDLVSVSTTTPACSNEVTGNASVTIDPLPVATITPTGSAICVNGSFTFGGTDASTANGTYAWSHNGFGSLANDNTLAPTYTPAGGDAGNTVTITLTVTSDNTCGAAEASDTYALAVDPLPVATIVSAGTTICENGSVTITDASVANGTYAWSISNGAAGTLSNDNSLTPTYTAAAGDAGHTVILTLTVNSNNVCGGTATDTYEITVDPLPVATVDQQGTTAICQNGSYTLQGGEANAQYGTYVWTWNGAGTLDDANTLTPTYHAVAGDAGNTVTLTLTVTSNNACGSATDVATYEIDVDPLPTASAGGSASVCVATPVIVSGASASNGTILWTKGNGTGTLTGETTLTPTYAPGEGDAGQAVILTMTVTSNNSCSPQTATATFTVNVHPQPTLTHTFDPIACFGGLTNVLLTQTGGTPPINYAITNSPVYQVPAGTYTYVVTDANGCSDTTKAVISNPALLAATLGGAQAVCHGQDAMITFTGTADITVEYSRSDMMPTQFITLNNNGEASLTLSALTSDVTITLIEATSTTPCTNVLSGSRTVEVQPLPEIEGTVTATGYNQTMTAGGSPYAHTICSGAAIMTSAPSLVSPLADACGTLRVETTYASTLLNIPSNTMDVTYAQAQAIGAQTITPENHTGSAQTITFTSTPYYDVDGDEEYSAGDVAGDPVVFVLTVEAELTLSAPDNMTASADNGLCGASVAFAATVGGTPAPMVVYSIEGTTITSPHVFPVGTTTVDIEASNTCDTKSGSFQVTVTDDQKPVFTTCMSDQTVGTDAGVCTYTHNGTGWDAAANDNCSVASLTYALSGATSGTGISLDQVVFNKGVTTVTWTATDASGNTETCHYDITVEDNEAPVITLLGNAVVDVCLGSSYTDAGATASDNCDNNLTIVMNNPVDENTADTYYVTYNVSDAAGNAATQVTRTVRVQGDMQAFVDGLTTTYNEGFNYAPACIASGDQISSISGTGSMVDLFNGLPSTTVSIAGYTLTGNQNDDMAGVKDALVALMVAETATGTVGELNGKSITFDVVFQDDYCTASVPFTINFNTTVPDAQQAMLDFIAAQNTSITENFNYAPACIASGDLISSISGTGSMVDLFNGLPNNVTTVSIAGHTLTGNPGTDMAAVKANLLALMQAYGSTVGDLNGESISFDVVFANAENPSCTQTVTYTITFDTTIPDAQQAMLDFIAGQNISITEDFDGLCLESTQLISSISGTGTMIDLFNNLPNSVTTVSIAGYTLTGIQPADMMGVKNALVALMVAQTTNGTIGELHGKSITFDVVFANKKNVACTETVTYTITFNTAIPDNPLTVTAPADITVDNENGTCEAHVSFIATTSGVPGANSVVYTVNGTVVNSGDVFPVGTTTVTVTATNDCKSVQDSFDITVTDDELPVISGCPSNITVSNDAGVCGAVVTWTAPTAADNCGVDSFGGDHASGDVFPVGTTTVTYTAVDVHGNQATCSFTVTVTDDELPVISGCPNNITVSNDAGDCGAVVIWTAPTAADNCGVASFGGDHASGDVFPVGTTTVTYTAFDVHGNQAICSFTVTVIDDELPVISGCPNNITVSNDAGICGAVVNWTAPTAADNCGMASFGGDHASGDVFPVGTTTVTYTAVDVHGNQATCSFTVTVTDDELPVISGCPNNIAVSNDAGVCGAVVNWTAPTAADNCGMASFGGDHASGDVFPVGTTTVTYTAVDVHGNQATCSFTVTVTDDELPVITGCPNNITVNNDAGDCGAVVTWTAPTADDNCSVASFVSDHASGETFPVGTTTVTYTATDGAGNQAICSFTVTVEDNEKPQFAGCPSDIQMSTNIGACDGATVTWVAPTATDNCAVDGNGVQQTQGPASGSYFPLGTTTIKYEVSDIHGNSSICSFTVTVTIVDSDGDGICDFLDSCPFAYGQIGDPCDDGDDDTTGDILDSSCNCVGTPVLKVSVRAMLQGPYNAGTGKMKDDLRFKGLLPAAQPYNVPAFGNYNGGETVAQAVLNVTGDNAIVDWVLVELRDKATPSTIVARRAALIQSDGDIVDLDGVSPVRFIGPAPDDYYVAVRHRNHFGVMTGSPMGISHVAAGADFTNPTFTTYGTDARKVQGGKAWLWCGNSVADQVMRYSGANNDRDPILVAVGGVVPTNVVLNVYANTDVNMDGDIVYSGGANDREPILQNLDSKVLGQRFQALP